MAEQTVTYDLVGKIIDYEDGNMNEQQTIDFFQFLYDTGIVWDLQGSYQRELRHLINTGKIQEHKESNDNRNYDERTND